MPSSLRARAKYAVSAELDLILQVLKGHVDFPRHFDVKAKDPDGPMAWQRVVYHSWISFTWTGPYTTAAAAGQVEASGLPQVRASSALELFRLPWRRIWQGGCRRREETQVVQGASLRVLL